VVRGNRVLRKLSLYNVLIAAVLLLVIFTTLYPFWYMIAVSLSKETFVLRGDVVFWPKGLNFRMYDLVLGDPRISTGYFNTAIYVIAGTAISLFATCLGAYTLTKPDMPLRKTFTLMIVITMFFSGGMIPTFLVVKGLSLVDTRLGMILPTAVSTWNLIIMRTFFYAFPKEIEESGKVDGMSHLGIFLRLVLPLSKPVLATIGLFYAVGMWNNFQSALLYLRSDHLYPLQVVLRNIVLQGQVIDAAVSDIGGDNVVVGESLKYATIIVSTVPILLIYPFLQKYFVRGALIGSVKG